MSIAVAVQKQGQIVIAADTQDNFGSSTVGIKNYRSKKILTVGDSYIAATGWGIYEDILTDYFGRASDVALDTKPNIFAFLMKFWKDLHEHYSLVKDQSEEEHGSPFGGLDATFLIANRHGIFYVSSNMSVTKFERYFAIGSGADFSLGVLYALYDTEMPPDAMAEKAVEAAKTFNIYCGGATDIFHIAV